MEKQIAIITARGGSKRIPRKNVKDFLGKPILVYSIEAALNAGIFDEVMVSTDDEEIAQIAKKAGAAVPFMRSEATSDDFATTADVIFEVIEKYKELGREFEQICCIYPTAPFVTAQVLKESMNLLEQKKVDGVVPVVQFSFPPQRGVVIEKERMQFIWPEHMKTRTQDLTPYYHDCGQYYCVNTEKFLQQKKMFMDNTYAYIRSEREVQDIDTEEDWVMAEMKFRLMKGNMQDGIY